MTQAQPSRRHALIGAAVAALAWSLPGTGLGTGQVHGGAVSAGEHGVGLLSQEVNVASVIGAPAGIGVIGGGHGPSFGFLADGQLFIPATLEIEEGL